MTQVEAIIEPDCVTDDFRWESVTFVCIHGPSLPISVSLLGITLTKVLPQHPELLKVARLNPLTRYLSMKKLTLFLLLSAAMSSYAGEPDFTVKVESLGEPVKNALVKLWQAIPGKKGIPGGGKIACA